MTLASTYNLWSVAGVVYGLAGAALICNAIFLIPPPARRIAGSDTVGGERDALRRMSQQWLDMRAGAVLLVIGFFLQATGAVGTSTLNTPAVFVLLGLAMFAGYYAMWRDLLAEDSAAAEAPSASSHDPIDDPVPSGHADVAVVTSGASLEAEIEEQRSETAA